jgi:DNA repair protein RadA/Sms
MKPRNRFICSGCGFDYSKWFGKCPNCNEFGTLAEQTPAVSVGVFTGTKTKQTRTAGLHLKAARPVKSIPVQDHAHRVSTGLLEFDGGQVLLLSGEPGCGKSTVLLTVADNIARTTGGVVLYLSGEESAHQLAGRAERIGAAADTLLFAESNDLGEILGHIEMHRSNLTLVVVDSVQTVASADVDGRPGGVSQVMEVANVLTRTAKFHNFPLFLVGQVTKESTVAGPRALEHVVDTTIHLEGDKQTSLRMMRAVKNRFGPADEIACFEQTNEGIKEVPDPSGLFRSTRSTPTAGTCITVTLEGRRPIITEMQALVAGSNAPNPRRGVTGLDTSRVTMLIAVTERHGKVKLYDRDVFTATVGGMRTNDPGCDLAVVIAIASAGNGLALPLNMCVIGEVSLSGDVRRVGSLRQRAAEAARLGFTRIVTPVGGRDAAENIKGVTIIEVENVGDAMHVLRSVGVGTGIT